MGGKVPDRSVRLARRVVERAVAAAQTSAATSCWPIQAPKRSSVHPRWRTKRSQSEVSVADVPDGAGEADRTDQVLLSWVVADALARLSPEHRAVLVECYYRGLPVAEAAERLGVPVGTVKSRAHYALRALRLALQERGVSA